MLFTSQPDLRYALILASSTPPPSNRESIFHAGNLTIEPAVRANA